MGINFKITTSKLQKMTVTNHLVFTSLVFTFAQAAPLQGADGPVGLGFEILPGHFGTVTEIMNAPLATEILQTTDTPTETATPPQTTTTPLDPVLFSPDEDLDLTMREVLDNPDEF